MDRGRKNNRNNERHHPWISQPAQATFEGHSSSMERTEIGLSTGGGTGGRAWDTIKRRLTRNNPNHEASCKLPAALAATGLTSERGVVRQRSFCLPMEYSPQWRRGLIPPGWN